jgi:pimeloyl-ACP methyl ester carboxylesterase
MRNEAVLPIPAVASEREPAQERWHSSEHSLNLPSCETCFVEAGAGFPIVLVHGLMAYSFSWRKNIPALAQHFRVLAPDLAGCGYSGPLKRGRYGIQAWSRQLEEFLDALQLPKVHLLATSAGGAVAIDFAARLPGRVDKLALVAPVNPFSRRVASLKRAYTLTGLPDAILKPLVCSAPILLPWLFRRYYFDPRRLTSETVPGFAAGIRTKLTVPMLRETICGWNPASMRDQIPRLKGPVLILWGKNDLLIPISCLPKLSRALPNASVAVIPKAGHLLYEEIPEVFNQHVLRFFSDSSTG